MDTPNSKHRRKHASEPSLIIDTDIHVGKLVGVCEYVLSLPSN